MKQDLSNQSKEQNLKKGEKKVKAAALLMMAMFFLSRPGWFGLPKSYIKLFTEFRAKGYLKF